MIKHIFFLVSFFVCIATDQAAADDDYICTFDDNKIAISVVYMKSGAKLPCEVIYKNGDRLETVWDEKEKEGVCEQKALEFARQHYDWGWRCDDIAPPVDVVAPSEPIPIVVSSFPVEQIADYKKAAAFAQVMALLSPFKMRMMEHYMMEGRYPMSLQDLGLNPIDMKNSSYISNLTIGDKGKIYVQGNETIGLDTVIMIRPEQTLGGMGNEWKCVTNVKLRSLDYCQYDIRLDYPD